MKMLYLYASVL